MTPGHQVGAGFYERAGPYMGHLHHYGPDPHMMNGHPVPPGFNMGPDAGLGPHRAHISPPFHPGMGGPPPHHAVDVPGAHFPDAFHMVPEPWMQGGALGRPDSVLQLPDEHFVDHALATPWRRSKTPVVDAVFGELGDYHGGYTRSYGGYGQWRF